MTSAAVAQTNMHKGYISKDRETVALLARERFSVRALFDVIVSQAFTTKMAVPQPCGSGVRMWDEGTRYYSLRNLARDAGMSVNTVQYGLKRLKALNLIERISNRLGTVIQALKFWQYRRKNENVERQPFFSHRGDTGRSQTDKYRCLPNDHLSKLTSIVDVPTLETAEKKEEGSIIKRSIPAECKKRLQELFS